MAAAIPPQDVYSAEVHNQTDNELTITVTYKSPKEDTEEVVINVSPGSKGDLEQKTLTEGSTEFTKVIHHLHVKAGEKSHALQAPFNVTSPTKGHKFIVKHEGDNLKIEN
eukprot:gb/GECH01011600.1/.p1 GENE.gb/GECH01011600.1/~~gb/GECH01011600.1/.p1  ORF type:complete len:110 (+),score=27.55 gb/GECH01011600.1/:1-330(+)